VISEKKFTIAGMLAGCDARRPERRVASHTSEGQRRSALASAAQWEVFSWRSPKLSASSLIITHIFFAKVGKGKLETMDDDVNLRPIQKSLAGRYDASGLLHACRLSAEYVADDNARKAPVILHRAIVGSLERFVGILIENHTSAMLLRLALVQVAILNISEAQSDYAQTLVQNLKKQRFRVQLDLRNEKIAYRIREHSIQKLSYRRYRRQGAGFKHSGRACAGQRRSRNNSGRWTGGEAVERSRRQSLNGKPKRRSTA
jgi:hypothetical protein